MKKWMALVLSVLLGLSLCACARKNTGVRYVSFQGKAYTINYDAHTISNGETTCTFSGSGDNIKLTYPDGTCVTLNEGLVKGADGRWDESVGFISVLRQEMPEGAPWVAVPAGIVLILIGLLNIVFPEKIWRWQHLLTVEGGEPTDFALSTNRFGGGLLVALGVFFLWAVVFG